MPIFFSNVTCWGDKVEQFVLNSAHPIMMLSETHLTSHKLTDVVPRLDKAGWRCHGSAAKPSLRSAKGRKAAAEDADPGLASTGGVHILSKKWLGVSSLHLQVQGADFCHAVQWRTQGMTLVLVVVYLDTNSQVKRVQQLKDLGSFMQSVRAQKLIAGDFNMTPQDVINTGFAARLGLEVKVAQVDATCTAGHGRVLDFCLVSRTLAATCGDPGATVVPWRPHIGQVLELPARPRLCKVMVQRMPRPLGLAKGPDIPDAWQVHRSRAQDILAANPGAVLGQPNPAMAITRGPYVDEEACEAIEHRHALLWATAESVLLGRCGREASPELMGRGQHWMVHLSDLVEPAPPEYIFKDGKMNWWASLAARLKELRHYMGRHTHPRCVQLVRGLPARLHNIIQELSEDEASWWGDALSAIGRGNLHASSPAVDAADLQVRRCASRAHTVGRRGWREWAALALTKGGGAAHAWTRRDGPPAAPAPQLDGDNLLVLPMERMQRRAQHWSEVWASGRGHPLHTHSGLYFRLLERARQEELQPLTLERVARTLKAFRTKGIGVDSWRPEVVATLPDEGIQEIHGLLRMIEHHLYWPDAARITKAVFLVKPNGADRAISIGTLLFRLWQRCRRPEVQAWAAGQARPWDTAGRGGGCLPAAYRRALTAELAVLSGKEAGAILWDIAGFFDSVPIDQLLRAAEAHGYPARILAASLIMHCGPRVLADSQHQHAELVVPGRSIMAGAVDSTELAKLALHDDVKEATDDFKEVTLDCRIDDMAQQAVTEKGMLKDTLGSAGVALASKLTAKGYTISPKSTVVASTARAAAEIKEVLKRAGFHVKVSNTCRDVGVDYGAGARRLVPTHKHRFTKGLRRLARIGKMAKVQRGSAKLTLTGAKPQALWGTAVMGVSPSDRLRLRAAYVNAAGHDVGGRCATTIISLRYGSRQDPLVSVILDILSTFLLFWRDNPGKRQDIKDVWAAVARAHGQAGCWRKVAGPISATYVSWLEMGWRPVAPDFVLDPAGDPWQFDPTKPIQPFIDHLADCLIDKLWQRMEARPHGAGAAGGVDFQFTKKRLKLWGSKHDTKGMATLLEIILSGAMWPAARLEEAGYLPDGAVCGRCGLVVEDLFHLFWGCPANDSIPDQAVSASSHLKHRARAEHTGCPILWLRGLPPADLYSAPLPPEHPVLRTWGHVPGEHDLQDVFFATDGSGGASSSCPRARRCGFALVALRVRGGQVELLYAAWGSLPGRRQTVPRAELHALTKLLQVADVQDRPIYTDSEVCFKRWQSGCRMGRSSMLDGWADFWQAHDRHDKPVITWVPSHKGVEEVGTAISLEAFLANSAADLFAEEAANCAQLDPFYIRKFQEADDMLSLIQSRLVAIAQATGKDRPPVVPKPPRPDPRWTRRHAIITSQHRLLGQRGRLTCMACAQTTRARKVVGTFVTQPCDGRVPATIMEGLAELSRCSAPFMGELRRVHPSHRMLVRPDVAICMVCGSWVTYLAKALRVACPGGPTSRGSRTCLGRWARGLDPVPPRTGRVWRRHIPDEDELIVLDEAC